MNDSAVTAIIMLGAGIFIGFLMGIMFKDKK